jgi:hypothetical protein
MTTLPKRNPSIPTPKDVVLGSEPSSDELKAEMLLETRKQLIQALEMDASNPRAHALMLVTLYQLRWIEVLQATLQELKLRFPDPSSLLRIARLKQLVIEERTACRLPMTLHNDFLGYLDN